MQISGANLLVAGQQPVRPNSAQAPFAPTAPNPASAKPEFAPLDFKRAAEKPADASDSSPSASSSASPDARTAQRPGSKLDIRV